MELANIIFILSLVHLSAQREVSKVAGFIVVRHIDSRIEYLMLKSSKPHGLWSPPKGKVLCMVSLTLSFVFFDVERTMFFVKYLLINSNIDLCNLIRTHWGQWEYFWNCVARDQRRNWFRSIWLRNLPGWISTNRLFVLQRKCKETLLLASKIKRFSKSSKTIRWTCGISLVYKGRNRIDGRDRLPRVRKFDREIWYEKNCLIS